MTENRALRSRYFGDRAFYKAALAVALPIMAQNFITNLVSMLDNLMVGALGTEPMSGVSIVNMLIFIFNLAVFGAMSGVGIFTAQFFGKNDQEGIRHTLRFKLFLALGISAAAMAILIAFPEPLIRLFLHASEEAGDLEQTLAFGREYLSVMLAGLLPFALTQVLAGTMRETGNTFTPMAAGFGAVAVNVVFNYLLIFGKFGFPEMGVRGAAVATVLSRFCELTTLIVYLAVRRAKYPYLIGAFRSLYVPGERIGDFLRKGMPLFFNELLWSAGMSALNVAFSHHGLNAVAANSIAGTVFNLFSIACMSMGIAIGIIAGKLLGADRHEEAVETVRRLIVFSVILGFGVGALMYFGGAAVPSLYKTSPESRALAAYFIRVDGMVMPAIAFANAAYFTLRSGGKTMVTFLFDSVFMWAVSVPVAFALTLLFKLEIHAVFPIVQSLDLLKCLVGYVMLKNKVWVRTIV